MTGTQQAILTQVLQDDIVPGVQQVAANFWQTKQASALNPLQGVFQTATANYTNMLTTAATTITSQLRNALQNSTQARNGALGLIQNENQLSSLGWTAAGAYYLEFARLNGQTLSLLSATPNVNAPSFQGLSPSLSYDLAPLFQSQGAFLTKLQTYVTTNDGLDAPGGNADLFSGATPGEDGSSAMEQVFRKLHLTERLLYFFTTAMSPTGSQWTDPFSALMQLGDKMIVTADGGSGRRRPAGFIDRQRRDHHVECPLPRLPRRRRDDHRAPADAVPGHADLHRLHGAADPGHDHRLRAADDPLGHVDGRGRRLPDPRL